MQARTRYGDCEAVRLRGIEPGNAAIVRTLLAPFDRVAPIARRPEWRRARPRRWLHALRRAAVRAHPFGGLRTADESRIRLLPYQLEPALAILCRGATRVLIGDDVGLGKTIQAGLILREISARTEGIRAIVVMPAALREQWRAELTDRFGLSSVLADAAWLVSAVRELPADVNPWSLSGIYIASYDFVKRPEVLRPLEDVAWDLAVFDEAHAASPATDRLAAAEAIACRSRRVLLLTATPHSGDRAQFDALCRLGSSGDGSPLVTFQRSRAHTGDAVPRRTVLLTVTPSRSERHMHRLLERYTARVQRESAGASPRAVLAAIVLRKRALSSAASLHASARRRHELLSGIEAVREFQLALPLGDEDPLPDDVADGLLAVPGLIDGPSERRMLSAIARAAESAAARETKMAFLVRLLRRIREPAIVFTEYRDTLSRLSRVLEAAGLRPQALHGGMPPDERSEIQRAFNASGTLLLATDAASEGLNLHHRCRTVVHYELPWSPVRLQQRTGRVDRIGQTARVHEILLVAGDTAERLVLAPLARRVVAARQATAGSSRLFDSLTESRVAAAILKGEDVPLPDFEGNQAAARGQGTGLEAAAASELRRLLERRAWRAQSPAGARAWPTEGRRLVTVLERTRGARLGVSLVLIFTVTLRDRDGQAVHEELVPVAIRRADAVEDARTHLERSLRRKLDDIAQAHRCLAGALERRERAIAAAVPRAAREIVQAGLFDRRAIRAHDARSRTAAALLADAAGRIEAIRAAGRLTVSFEVTAKLLVGSHPGR